MSPPDRYAGKAGKGVNLALLAMAHKRPAIFISDLKVIATQAHFHATNEAKFSNSRRLLGNIPVSGAEAVIATRILWPILFDIWTSAGKRLASTENGKTIRFIEFVHGVAELPPPTRSTLRDAIAQWKKANGRPVAPTDRHGGGKAKIA
jgi:hypothetical protein